MNGAMYSVNVLCIQSIILTHGVSTHLGIPALDPNNPSDQITNSGNWQLNFTCLHVHDFSLVSSCHCCDQALTEAMPNRLEIEWGWALLFLPVQVAVQGSVFSRIIALWRWGFFLEWVMGSSANSVWWDLWHLCTGSIRTHPI